MSADLTQRAKNRSELLVAAMRAYFSPATPVQGQELHAMTAVLDGLLLDASRADIYRDVLLDARAYFAERAEADAPDTEGYVPNEEMRLLAAIDAALAKAGETR